MSLDRITAIDTNRRTGNEVRCPISLGVNKMSSFGKGTVMLLTYRDLGTLGDDEVNA
jgi:hypothetical protein